MYKVGIEDIRGFCYEDEKLYIVSSYIRSVMIYDFRAKKIGALGHYPSEVRMMGAFEGILKFGIKIYLFPCLADSIYYYDIQKQEYIQLYKFDTAKEHLAERKFFEALIYNGFIYAVCRYPNMVICINPRNDEVQVWRFEKTMNDDMLDYHFSLCVYENKLIYPYSSHILIEFLIDKGIFHVVSLKDGESYSDRGAFGGINRLQISSEGNLWLCNLYGDVYRVVENSKAKIEMPMGLSGFYNDGFNGKQFKINRMLLIDDKLYFVLYFDQRILVYDIYTQKFSWCENQFAIQRADRRAIFFDLCMKKDSNTYLLYCYNDEAIYVWSIEKGFIERIELKFSIDEICFDEALEEYLLHTFLTRDNLEVYISYVAKNHNITEGEKHISCGEKIYYSC